MVTTQVKKALHNLELLGVLSQDVSLSVSYHQKCKLPASNVATKKLNISEFYTKISVTLHTPCTGKVSLETSFRELLGKEKCIAGMCNSWLDKLSIAQIPTMVCKFIANHSKLCKLANICKLLALGESRLSFKMYHHSFSFTIAVTVFIHRFSTSFTIEMCVLYWQVEWSECKSNFVTRVQHFLHN